MCPALQSPCSQHPFLESYGADMLMVLAPGFPDPCCPEGPP